MWLVFPFLIIGRMWLAEPPFTVASVAETAAATAAATAAVAGSGGMEAGR